MDAPSHAGGRRVDTFRWLMSPVQEVRKGRLDPKIVWEAVQVSPAAQNLAQEIENKLRENEWLVTEWSPIHLLKVLNDWYFREGVAEVGALKVWQDSCHYLYLPRLLDSTVYQGAIRAGIETKDFFGFAGGKEDGKYLGFAFGRATKPVVDESALLIERESARAYVPVQTGGAGTGAGIGTGVGTGGGTGTGTGTGTGSGTGTGTGTGGGSQATRTRFYGTVSLDPVKAKFDFAQIVDEVVQHFTTKPNAEVTISVEIQAEDANGFDDGTQRAVRENCNVLKFSSAEFESE